MNVTKGDITTYLKQVLNDGAEYAKADGLKTIGEWFPGVDLRQLASQEFGATLEPSGKSLSGCLKKCSPRSALPKYLAGKSPIGYR
jgi:hypothetical protein